MPGEQGFPSAWRTEKQKSKARRNTLLRQKTDVFRILNELRDRMARLSTQHDRGSWPVAFLNQGKSRTSITRQSLGIAGGLQRHASLPQKTLNCFGRFEVFF